MKNRIVALRKDLKLSQEKFAEKVKISRNFIALVERGERGVSDRTIRDICTVFRVNEEWLREGTGPMYREDDEGDIAALEALISEDNPLYSTIRSIVKTYMSLDDSSKKVILDFIQRLKENPGG